MNKGKLKTFAIDFTSDLDGETFQGSFTTRKLSILDQTKISRRKSELCGGMYCVRDEDGEPTGQGIDEWTEYMNYMIALLETALISKPTWWDLDLIYDEGLVGAVFKEVMAFENSFRRRVGEADSSEGSGGRSEGSGKEEYSEALPSNVPTKVVDGQVQGSLDA